MYIIFQIFLFLGMCNLAICLTQFRLILVYCLPVLFKHHFSGQVLDKYFVSFKVKHKKKSNSFFLLALQNLFFCFQRQTERTYRYPNVCTGYHHIFPHEMIAQKFLIPITQLDYSTIKGHALLTELHFFINVPPVKKVLLNLYNNSPNTNFGTTIHSAISYFPHNLIYGPVGHVRLDDRRRGIDYPLLNWQTTSYVELFRKLLKYPTLINYGSLPPPTPVPFLHNRKGQYFVQNKQ